MQSSNLAWRIEPQDDAVDASPESPTDREPSRDEALRMHSRTRFDCRTIEIRDEGFAPFRGR